MAVREVDRGRELVADDTLNRIVNMAASSAAEATTAAMVPEIVREVERQVALSMDAKMKRLCDQLQELQDKLGSQR